MQPSLKSILTLLLISFLTISTQAQNLPLEMKITPDGRLTTGGNPVTGLYDPSQVHRIDFTLTQNNWFQLMDGSGMGPNATPGIELIGTLAFNNTMVFDSVLIGIKGATSDFANNSEKKSFSVDLDAIKDHDLMGYDNLNLNCGFQDPSSMRELLYYDQTRSFAPATKGAFVDLYINGTYWGPYSNIQQIEGTYIKEWFLDNDGTRWRAIKPDAFTGGPGGGTGGPFGTGYSTLNYLGADSTDYTDFYTLKSTESDDPWAALVHACDELNNLPSGQLYDELKYAIDVDRALWFLAQEIIFTDEDSYVWKGGMDYYVYHDAATNRIIPLEVDGNSSMLEEFYNWSPFYNQSDNRFPLMNRLFANPELRQRYLAHVRTVLEEYFIADNTINRIDEFAALLDQRVQDDPKKIYSHTQFLNGVNILKNFVDERHDYLSAHNEVNKLGLAVANATFSSANGVGVAPDGGESVTVSVDVSDPPNLGVFKVRLYYGGGLQGAFERTDMTDDNNDGTFEGIIPGFAGASYVRYYVEAIANDLVKTAVFFPKGAEHDVFLYQVNTGAEQLSDDIAINEIMASNNSTASDEAGEFEDWIELYNNTATTVDLSDYYLSDDESNLLKWAFPEGTTLDAGAYLIVWADNDQGQGPLHCNFKLAASGESVLLVNPNGDVVNRADFGEQTTDASYSRIPNGLGSFVIKNPTFGYNNEATTSVVQAEAGGIRVFPNPADGYVRIELEGTEEVMPLQLRNVLGQVVLEGEIFGAGVLDLSGVGSGVYFLEVGGLRERLVVGR
jgi:CotH kinase protein/Lamin Tail Domain/Secretion system C-terminal sorting domain